MPITNVNYAAEYSQALAQMYPYLSYFATLLAANNSNRYKTGMGKTMYIPTVTVTGARDVNRNSIDGSFSRNWNNQWQAVELQMDREWDTLVDPMDIDETAGVAAIANITRAFVESQKVPEMDAFIASKLAGFASSFGGTSTTSLTSASVASLSSYTTFLMAETESTMVPNPTIFIVGPTFTRAPPAVASMPFSIAPSSSIVNVGRLNCSARSFSHTTSAE